MISIASLLVGMSLFSFFCGVVCGLALAALIAHINSKPLWSDVDDTKPVDFTGECEHLTPRVP